MPPKARIPAPIDRPLSRAYLRQFTGWSTVYPPGLSDPASLRIMENVAVTRDGACRIRPGMRYLSYSQPPNEIAVPHVTPLYVGKSVTASNYPDTGSSIPLPAGTQVGDLLVLTLINGYGAAAACGDSRMTMVDNTNEGGRSHGVWVGYASTLGALSVSQAGNNNTLGQFWIGSVTAWRGSDGPLEWSPSDVVTVTGTNTTDLIPGLSNPTLSGAICSFATDAGLGGVYFMQDWSKAPAYTLKTADDNSYIEIDVALTTTVPVPAQTTPNTGSSSWTATVIGFRGSTGGVEVTPVGIGSTRPLVGTHEAFYLNDGTKAYLLAVREEDETVGFRVLVVDTDGSTMYDLTDPEVDFAVPQGSAVLNFSSATTYVKYLQIDNKVFALSDAGEPMRIFTVGATKTAKALAAISRPDFEVEDKLDVLHPDATWINDGTPTGSRINRLWNPSFENNTDSWSFGKLTGHKRVTGPASPVSGSRTLRLESLPTRTNLAASPLHNVASTGIEGWVAGEGDPVIVADTSYLKVPMPAKGSYFARTKRMYDFEGGQKYLVAFDCDGGAHVDAKVRIQFHGVNGTAVGSIVERDIGSTFSRWVSTPIIAPKNAVSAVLSFGGENTGTGATYVRIKNVVICPADQSTAMFHGGSGANYFWTGGANMSASVYHPAADLKLTSTKRFVKPGKALVGSIYLQAGATARATTLKLRYFDKDSNVVGTNTGASINDTVGSMLRYEIGIAAIPSTAVRAELELAVVAVPRGEYHYADAAMLETDVSVAGSYFDGATTDTGTIKYEWKGDEHDSPSVATTYAVASTVPTAETRTADTLVATGGPAVNTYQFGFFYTFNNEVGESAASKITVQRTQRGWSEWVWETPNVSGEPSGTATSNPRLCADQLVAIMPQDVYDEAVAQGATSWSLYMFTWAEQDTVPVTALKVGTRGLPPGSTYAARGWIRVTPQMSEVGDISVLPTLANRYNFSDPSRASQGLVAADRMILVHDPSAAAVIRWTSNQQGHYTDFTANKGGGYKTLTSGNLYVPAAVKLWQNPQSVDTITILCQGTDGHSTGFYMAPAQVASQSEATNIMGFEETTATPGTTSPYGVEVFNNALYHPLDDQLMKSTAANYNINHKSVTDLIRNSWERLSRKEWIISALHDNRLYYIVNNPDGELLEEGCNGNEIWVLDGGTDKGTWSRYLIQAHSLRKIEFGGRIFLSVIRPDGVYYLDPEYGLDDYVNADLEVHARAIPWALETNTQGANRAHDAWAHLQQLGIILGNFTGELRYGIRSWDINGKPVEISKIVRDLNPPDKLTFDREDFLQVRKDLKEWYFFAGSTQADDGTTSPSYGQLNLVQYRYTPSTVNTGYELGSVETFEYGRAEAGAPTNTTDGIPVPIIDTRRP